MTDTTKMTLRNIVIPSGLMLALLGTLAAMVWSQVGASDDRLARQIQRNEVSIKENSQRCEQIRHDWRVELGDVQKTIRNDLADIQKALTDLQVQSARIEAAVGGGAGSGGTGSSGKGRVRGVRGAGKRP